MSGGGERWEIFERVVTGVARVGMGDERLMVGLQLWCRKGCG